MMGENTFTILPMSQRVSLEAGDTYVGKISVVNPANATNDFSYTVSVSPYSVVGENYTADLTTEYNRSMITKWIEIPEPSGVVKPNETKDVEFKITVPENAPSGGQYATIIVTSNNDTVAGSGVAINNVFEMASIIYANIQGDTVIKGEILDNSLPGFTTKVPVIASAVISNEGNTHLDATFVISVKDVFTGRVILPTEEDTGKYNELIMPETTRTIEREINNLPALGIVKVKQLIYYNGDFSELEKDIIICPIWFMALVAATLIAIAITIIAAIKKHRKKKKGLKAV